MHPLCSLNACSLSVRTLDALSMYALSMHAPSMHAPGMLSMTRAPCQQPKLALLADACGVMHASPFASPRRPCGPVPSLSAVRLSRHCAARNTRVHTRVGASDCVWGMGGRAEMSKVIGAKWKGLSADEKKPFEDEVRARSLSCCVPETRRCGCCMRRLCRLCSLHALSMLPPCPLYALTAVLASARSARQPRAVPSCAQGQSARHICPHLLSLSASAVTVTVRICCEHLLSTWAVSEHLSASAAVSTC